VTHRHGPEAVLVDRLREQRADPIRSRIGRQVPVRRLAPEEKVPQGSADEVRGMAVRAQSLDDLADGTRDRPGRQVEGIRVGQFRPRKR
jgi:hypothetical protein